MDLYTTEDQQVEALKRWWKENAKSVVAGVILGLAAVLGWRTWQAHQQDVRQRASAQYEQMVQAVQGGEWDKAHALGDTLIKDFGSTSYAFFSALALARIELERNQLPSARAHLEWALAHVPQPALAHIARLRLARVMLAQGQGQQALDLVKGTSSPAFQAQYREVEGDAYRALGQRDQARQAYAQAVKEAAGENRQRLQMKLDDLGGEQAS